MGCGYLTYVTYYMDFAPVLTARTVLAEEESLPFGTDVCLGSAFAWHPRNSTAVPRDCTPN
jgi:hypothetical protein